MAEITSGSSFEPSNLTEQKLFKSENDLEKKTLTLKELITL